MLGSGERGAADAVVLLFLAHAWSAVLADLCRELLPSQGWGYFIQPWERSEDEALTHADLAVISVPPSKTKVQGNSLIFHSSVASLHLSLGVCGLTFPQNPLEWGGSSSWQVTQKSCHHPGAPKQEVSLRQWWQSQPGPGFCPRLFLSGFKPGLYIVMPELGLWPVSTHHLQFCCWESEVHCCLFFFFPTTFHQNLTPL